jgi:septum formation protein
MKIILASASRDRKRLFEVCKIPVEIIPSDFNEDSIIEPVPERLVQKIALGKALTVKSRWNATRALKEGPALIIAADTMVVRDHHVIGKAESEQHAFEILSSLKGTTHNLITGCIILKTDDSDSQYESYYSSSNVHFQSLTAEEIWDYIKVTDEYRGRAGAYSLQERAGLFIDYIEGSPSNVLGISMSELRIRLKKYGINLLNPNRNE